MRSWPSPGGPTARVGPRAPGSTTSRSLRLALVALAAVLVAGCAAPADPARDGETVARVGDGDTLDVRGGERIRLLQIDAPELGEGECFARQSQRELERLAPPGAAVELEPDPDLDDEDRFGRLLRYVYAADIDVNVELVRRGAATPYFLGGDEGRYADELLDAVAAARDEQRGMWGSCRVEWSPTRPVATHPR